jgi:hypothetical protein
VSGVDGIGMETQQPRTRRTRKLLIVPALLGSDVRSSCLAAHGNGGGSAGKGLRRRGSSTSNGAGQWAG